MRNEYLEGLLRLHKSRLKFWSNVYKYTKINHKKKKAATSIYVFKGAVENIEKELDNSKLEELNKNEMVLRVKSVEDLKISKEVINNIQKKDK